jgi:hypothetical protein
MIIPIPRFLTAGAALAVLLCLPCALRAQAPDTWTQKADAGSTQVAGPTARSGAFSFSINGKGYLGGGTDGSVVRNDFWEFDPTTNAWTQKASFPGAPRQWAVAFAIGSRGYAGTGGNANAGKDFYMYDPVANAWTKKADFGGGLRVRSYGFSIGSKGYIGGGIDNFSSRHADLWAYDRTYNRP